jgi:DNA-binding NtrC family response regulator
MQSLRRLLLAAGDPRLVQSVQTHLLHSLQVSAPIVRFDDVTQLLTPETDGDLVFIANDSVDAIAIENLVREIKVQQLPPALTAIESNGVYERRLLDHLSPYLAGRFVWPNQIRDFTNWACRALQPGAPFADPATETVAQKIRRRLINQTPSLTNLVDQLCIAASHDVTVLLEGESGTGKTFLARLIHDCSARRIHRFMVFSCGAHPAHIFASELYGQCHGWQNGSEGTKVGKLAAVGEGTLLLDEIDTLPLDQQANLLRVIETGEYEPVGSTETKLCKARLIATTTWNLADAVERGAFRRDLYYRLQVINFQLPPLRHRPEDVGPLVRAMVARFGTRFGKRLFSICPEALRALEAYPWPGNIRQLENVIQQAVLTSAGNELKVHHLSPMIDMRITQPTPTLGPTGSFVGTLKQSRESSERANILRALEKAGQSRTRAAQLLGVSRVTLYKKMKKYGLYTKTLPQYPFTAETYSHHPHTS